ncbi:MAG TPA: proton-conducting transporter membrane subunit [Phycisphaerae bacterium]|nr:proton-conducting transporter membrane subunit [Phycisphaerae bacterium]HRY71087.1 proton-conducting transporter membrane subunit [Phycisphaerae bacterium]HSA29738.1 proton-conducting transporter membrane subunit [Phycisphaerae bacterium]
MIAALFLIPSLAGLTAFFIRSDTTRRTLLMTTAIGHTILTTAAWWVKEEVHAEAWLALDALGLLFLSITSLLFLVTAVYCLGYLGREPRGSHHDIEEGFLISNAPEAVFTGCLLVFLGMMSLVCVSAHFGLIWVAVEATTLASAPLIYFHRHHRSLEATWKYLLICSVGIALALLGNFFLAVAAATPDGSTMPLVVQNLMGHGDSLHGAWLRAAFVFLIVGYGTKMGLAPLHTWLPDAHSESPSVVSALLSGALLNCAFLSILRAQQVLSAAGCAAFGQDLLLLLGLVSIAVAAVFIVGQADYKRMLAYSSVEHVGILALGVGLGGAGAFGAMLHAVNHSLTKAMLFLVAGNILAVYGTKSSGDVRGVLRVLPVSGLLWVTGFLAITGSPPFGIFLSEFTVLKAALDQGRPGVAALYLALLAVIFVGMASVFLKMAQGEASGPFKRKETTESWSSTLPPVTLALVVLMLGVHVPAWLSQLLHQAAQALGGS